MSNPKRWRGLVALIGDAVEHGSTAVERIHMATAQRPFQIIEQIPQVAAPTKVVHGIHDAVVTNTYKQIRWVNGLVQKLADVALDETSRAAEPAAPAEIPDKI